MNNLSRGLVGIGLAVLISLFLQGCAVRTAQGTMKLDEMPAPVQDITMVIYFGHGIPSCPFHTDAYNTTFRSAMTTRMPAIFEKNGISVKKILVEPIPIKYKKTEGEYISLSQLDKINTSHALVLIAEKFVYPTPCVTDLGVWAHFEAKLWDLNKKRPVWSAEPRLFLTLKHPLLRSQHFAGTLLRGLQNDGIVKLENDSGPVDLDGKAVSDVLRWAVDK